MTNEASLSQKSSVYVRQYFFNNCPIQSVAYALNPAIASPRNTQYVLTTGERKILILSIVHDPIGVTAKRGYFFALLTFKSEKFNATSTISVKSGVGRGAEPVVTGRTLTGPIHRAPIIH
jgi:hypothetical protein